MCEGSSNSDPRHEPGKFCYLAVRVGEFHGLFGFQTRANFIA
jgi:hypothetical protein